MSIDAIDDVSLEWLTGPLLRTGCRFGVEHEFSVSRGASTVDFRTVISARAMTGRRLDRSDPFAHRLPWGGVVTADGREAECATPPALLAPGFTDRIRHWVDIGRHELELVAEDARLEGYSTHLNVEVDDRHAVALAHRFAARHSGALMLLMDGADSPGLLVRPRRSRLEFGAEYVTGEQLVAASVFAAAATKECESSRWARRLAAPRVLPARGRFGLFVDRSAYGSDLSAQGRAALVGRHSAQDLLTWSWERCRVHAEAFASAHEIAVVDRIVDGTLPLPSEYSGGDGSAPLAGVGDHLDVTVARQSGAMRLDPILATWDHVCFSLLIGGVSRVVAVPAAAAGRVVEAFESGELDPWCRRVAAVPSERLAILSSADQIGSGGVFSTLHPDATLMPPERDPRSGRPGGVGNPPGQRQQKNHDDNPPPRRMRHKRVAMACAAGLVVIAGAAAVASRDDTSSGTEAPITDAAAVASTSPVSEETVAAVVPITEAAASTTAAPTTVPTPICSAVGLSPNVTGANDAAGTAASLAAGAEVSTDGTGYAELRMGATTTRIDANSAVACTDETTLTQTNGRTWTRTTDAPIVVRTAQGDVTIAPGSVVVIDCTPAPGCTVLVIQGGATAPGDVAVQAPGALSLAPAGAVQVLVYDAVFGDPWINDNTLRDVAAGLPSAADAYQSYGPATASLTGTYTGQRTIITSECTGAGQCDPGAPYGDVAPRTYNFSVACTSVPCAPIVQAEFQNNNSVQVADVPVAFDGTAYTWDINITGFQCSFDLDGNGTRESLFGTRATPLQYVMTPTAAEVRNGQYVVTAIHATADASSTVVAPDPQCAAFGPYHTVSDITASR